MDVLTILTCHHFQYTRIYITASGAHNQTFQRSQSHGGVDTFAVFYGRNGTAIAHMASDDTFAGRVYAKVFADTLGYITVGRAMEAVTADAVFFIHLVGRAYI